MKRKYANFADPTPIAPAETQDEEFEIIKNKRFAMLPMTPEEAILQMNLLNHDFFVFFDPDLGSTSVVYRRKDGKYGLLTPELK
jgi:putative sigma-54 modulation protein